MQTGAEERPLVRHYQCRHGGKTFGSSESRCLASTTVKEDDNAIPTRFIVHMYGN
jgi:hypothetical protein